MWLWENCTALPPLAVLLQRGKRGPPTITASSSQVWRGDACVERNAKEKEKQKIRRKKQVGEEHLPESPTGAESVVPPVSPDEGPESGESVGRKTLD